ncbi:MAG: crotonase/enoyl-CoA hydratase family protein [Rhodovibrionaceae bacterium]
MKSFENQNTAVAGDTAAEGISLREVKPDNVTAMRVVQRDMDPAWLTKARTYNELELDYDREDALLWCYMSPQGRPSYSMSMLREICDLQEGVKQYYTSSEDKGENPLQYMVWGSRVPGTYNLGGDLNLFRQLIVERDRKTLTDYAVTCIDAVHRNVIAMDLPIITISLVQGDALGGGFEHALSGNVVIAERQSKFGLPEVLFNLFPGMGAYSLIARKIGAAMAERMIFSGKVYSAEELHEIGLVDILCEEGQGEEAVDHFIAQNRRRHNARCAIYKAARRFHPVTHEELRDIALLWVDTALTLKEADLKKMGRLAKAQERRTAADSQGRTAISPAG